MSVTLATVADALIEFILSLLRDPAAAAEFDADPEAAIAGKGLSGIRPQDVCAVAPVVAESAHVAPIAKIAPVHPGRPDHPDAVVKEIKNITSNFSWVDDRDTIVDQSVNQNIWAKGDVTQIFDNEANVASGDHSIAAGDDVDQKAVFDQSTNIHAGDDANVGNDVDTTITDDSNNTSTDSSSTTTTETDIAVTDSLNDSSTTATATDSFNDSAASYTGTHVDADVDVIADSSDSVIVDDATTPDDQF